MRQKAMAQQLCKHAQSLVGEILVDEGFLSGQSLCRTAGGLVIVFLVSLENLWVQLGHRGKAIFFLPVGGVLRLPENELSAGRAVAEIQPIQYPRVQDPFIDGAARLSGVNTADHDIDL
jgi:hypothetical protein